MTYFYWLDWENRIFGYVLYNPRAEVVNTLLDAAKKLEEMGYFSSFALGYVLGQDAQTLELQGFTELSEINTMMESILSFYNVKNRLDAEDHAQIGNA